MSLIYSIQSPVPCEPAFRIASFSYRDRLRGSRRNEDYRKPRANNLPGGRLNVTRRDCNSARADGLPRDYAKNALLGDDAADAGKSKRITEERQGTAR